MRSPPARIATTRWSPSAPACCNGMSQREAEAVLAHEVSHVANGDMVTLTLIQGVVNTFVVFLSRVIGYTVDRVVFKTERGHGPAFLITMIIAQLVLGILASMIVMWFSRHREFRADAGGAQLAGRQNMIGALERLRQRSPGAAARFDAGLRHQHRQAGRRSEAPVHDAPAAGGAHRGAPGSEAAYDGGQAGAVFRGSPFIEPSSKRHTLPRIRSSRVPACVF